MKKKRGDLDHTIPHINMKEYTHQFLNVVSTKPDSPHSFWLRIVEKSWHVNYLEMKKSLDHLYSVFFADGAKPFDDEMCEIMLFLNDQATNVDLTKEDILTVKRETFHNVGVYFDGDNFHRVIIKKWDIDNTLVFLVDSGESQSVNPDYILQLHSSLKLYPQFAINCCMSRLRLPENEKWSDEAITYFRNCLFEGSHWQIFLLPTIKHDFIQYPVLIGQSGDKSFFLHEKMICYYPSRLAVTDSEENFDDEEYDYPRAHFYDERNQRNINLDDPGVHLFGYASKDEAIICPQFGRTGYCVKGESCRKEHLRIDTSKFTTMPQLVFSKAIEKLYQMEYGVDYKPLWIRIAIGELHVVLEEDVPDLSELRKLFSRLNNAEEVAKYEPMEVPPGLGEIVLVTAKSGWERAQCFKSEETDSTYDCLLVDSGGIVTVGMRDMRAMPRWAFNNPFYMRRLKLLNFKIDDTVKADIDLGWTIRLVGRADCDIVTVEGPKGSLQDLFLKLGYGFSFHTYYTDKKIIAG